jgi:hypothetical protein
MLTAGYGFGGESGVKTAALPGERMCPACLVALTMIVAGTGSTGGAAAVLIHKFRVKGVKKMVGVSRSEWTQTKEKESHEQASYEQENHR